ncbi:mitochondrial carrier [Xylaria sp. FL1042]|nr:mitochondrial carrier [Xylaria sp. FL1042]
MAREEAPRSYLQSLLDVTKSADFWAGWVSGALGIMAGNSLDRRKVLLQAQQTASQPLLVKHQSSPLLVSSSLRSLGPSPSAPSLIIRYFQSRSPLAGAAAPSLGAGALNAVLYVTYNRTEDALNRALLPSTSPASVIPNPNSPFSTTGSNLWTTWLAGAAGGLAIWLVSTPTELIKCKAQLASILGTQPSNQSSLPSSSSSPTSSAKTPPSSWDIAKTIFRTEGIRGLYRGGVVTALRDSIGYGFYFWAFELGCREMTSLLTKRPVYAALSFDTGGIDSNENSASSGVSLAQEAVKTVLCGGVAGVVTWASVFPFDVVKTRVQTQVSPTTMPPFHGTMPKQKGALQVAKELYITEGPRAFFRGLAICSARAFFVNAFQWPIYKVVLFWRSQSNHDRREE